MHSSEGIGVLEYPVVEVCVNIIHFHMHLALSKNAYNLIQAWHWVFCLFVVWFLILEMVSTNLNSHGYCFKIFVLQK